MTPGGPSSACPSSPRRRLGAAALAALLIRWRRRRPATWAIAVARRMERAGARAGRPRRLGETVTEYAAALDTRAADASGTWSALAWLIEASAYGRHEPSADERRRADHLSRTTRIDRRRRGTRTRLSDPDRSAGDDPLAVAAVSPTGGPGPRPDSPAPPPGGGSPSAGGAD